MKDGLKSSHKHFLSHFTEINFSLLANYSTPYIRNYWHSIKMNIEYSSSSSSSSNIRVVLTVLVVVAVVIEVALE